MTLFSMAILFMVFQSSYQKKYSCDSTLECGCSAKPASFARVVGGEEASKGSWGWVVSLSIKDGVNLCGGSIISSLWIITAAHCLENISPSDLMVYAGSNTVWSGTQNRSVSQIIVHSEYDSDTFVYDIGLLKLTTPLDMGDPDLGAICLPSVDSEILAAGEWPVPKTTVIAVGWGRLFENGPTAGNLQQVTLQTINYQTSSCSNLLVDRQVQFCAGATNGEKDTCQGDSGGPLMMFTPNKQWVLVGLTSFGYGCARKSYSGIYTRVAALKDWIKIYTDKAYSKSEDGPYSPNYIINSYATTTSTWNYRIFLPNLLVYFFILLTDL